ncbi:MAG TPA: sulfurtransferase [Planctomycetota bacterium]|nr:sulfurtransferase [Planctomycetota bacterium]
MEKTYPHGNDAVKWVSTDWLAQHIGDKDLMIVDTQPDVHDYFRRHVPGATYMNEGLLRVPLNGMPTCYIPDEAMQMILRRVGIRAEVPTVVYSGSGGFKCGGDGLEQTMLAYSLIRFGHQNIYILDGGMDKWMAERKPVSQDFPTIRQSDFTVDVHGEYLLTYNEFKRIKDDEDVMVLDVRPARFYEGQGPWTKPGHIPGAVNLPWMDLMDHKNKRLLKPDDEINEMLRKLDIAPDKTLITSCGTGREATNVFLLLRFYLGFPNVRIYEGSFTEWVALDNPTVVGSQPHETATDTIQQAARRA